MGLEEGAGGAQGNGDSTGRPRCGSATAPAVLGQQQSRCQPPAASHMFGGAGKENAELVPAVSSFPKLWPFGYTKPIWGSVLGDSQTFNSAAALWGEKSVFGAGREAGCVWDLGAKGVCEVPVSPTGD